MASPRLDETFCIPAEARDLEGFRVWARSPRFPQRGRLDYLGGDIEVDMSPEDLYTHGTLKMEVATLLHALVTKSGMGVVFTDRTRISSPPADFSVEPDVVAVLWKTLDGGRLREIPSAGERPGRYIELEGAPDLVVEIVSDGSVGKDLKRLPGFFSSDSGSASAARGCIRIAGSTSWRRRGTEGERRRVPGRPGSPPGRPCDSPAYSFSTLPAR